MPRILVIFGPNLNLLGEREPELYGSESFEEMTARLHEAGRAEGVAVDVFHSNHEGDLIDRLQEARGSHDAVVLNAGALTHTSLALRDAVASIRIPVVEAHLTNPARREGFRRRSVLASVCAAVVQGFGSESMVLALRGAAALVRQRPPAGSGGQAAAREAPARDP